MLTRPFFLPLFSHWLASCWAAAAWEHVWHSMLCRLRQLLHCLCDRCLVQIICLFSCLLLVNVFCLSLEISPKFSRNRVCFWLWSWWKKWTCPCLGVEALTHAPSQWRRCLPRRAWSSGFKGLLTVARPRPRLANQRLFPPAGHLSLLYCPPPLLSETLWSSRDNGLGLLVH